MPVIPYSADAVTHTTTWRTDVLKSLSGKEERICLLDRPREAVEMEIVFTDDEARAARGSIFANAMTAHEVPLRFEAVALQTAAQAASDLVVDSTLCDWVAVGQRVMVENAAGDWYDSQISAIDATTPAATLVTLADDPTVGVDFLAWVSHLMPLLSVHLDPDQAHARRREMGVADDATEARWSVRGQAPAFRATWGTGASLTTFDGLTVLDAAPLGDGLVQELAASGATILDSGGVVGKERTWTESRIRRAHDFEAATAAERQWWKLFLYTVRGQWQPFLLPTWRPDLPVTTGIAAGGDTIDVTSTELIDSLAHTRVQVAYASGTIDYHEIVTATDNLDGTHAIEFTPVFAENVDATTVISWLELVRLADDGVAWEWQEGLTASLSLAFWTIQDTGGATSAPREAYTFTADGRIYRYTTAARSFTYGGNSYTPLAGLTRSDPGLRPLDPQDVTISMPRSATFVTENAYGVPPGSMSVTIVYVEEVSGTGVEIWQGKIAGISVAGKVASFRVPHFLDSSARTSIPAVYCQPTCPHQLYGDRCGVVRADHDVSTTVSTVAERAITVASVGGNVDGWAVGGELVVRQGSADEERRTVITQVGTALVVQHPFRSIAASAAVVLYAGCDRLISTCIDKFNNLRHTGGGGFGGFPYAPKVAMGTLSWLDPQGSEGSE